MNTDVRPPRRPACVRPRRRSPRRAAAALAAAGALRCRRLAPRGAPRRRAASRRAPRRRACRRRTTRRCATPASCCRGTILVDGHNDLPIAVRGYKAAPMDVVAYDLRQRDARRHRHPAAARRGWSARSSGRSTSPAKAPDRYARVQLEQIDLARRIIARYPDTFRLATTAAEIRAAHRAGRIASMLGMEGGYALENSLGALRAYYDLGVRYMTLTHNTHTDWADSAAAGADAPRRPDAVRRGGRARDEPPRHAGGPRAHLARHDGRRAARQRGAGDLLARRGARPAATSRATCPTTSCAACRGTAAS